MNCAFFSLLHIFSGTQKVKLILHFSPTALLLICDDTTRRSYIFLFIHFIFPSRPERQIPFVLLEKKTMRLRCQGVSICSISLCQTRISHRIWRKRTLACEEFREHESVNLVRFKPSDLVSPLHFKRLIIVMDNIIESKQRLPEHFLMRQQTIIQVCLHQNSLEQGHY